MPDLRSPLIALLVLAATLAACGCHSDATPPATPTRQQEAPTVEDLRTAMATLAPLHKKLGPPQPGDWLARFHEPGQTFTEYLACDPVTPNEGRRVIYVQPLGEFTQQQRKIVTLTADFMGRFFHRPVIVRGDLSSGVIPPSARRTNPQTGQEQFLSTYVLDSVLPSRLADDAAACIAFTPTDLWPGEGWNYVFGQASLRSRVGVWSLARNGDPAAGDEAFRLCLLRTIKTAVHETGHMFSMQHCTAWQCVMCGCNHLEESDRRPLALCPECLAKVCWATGADPLPRYRSLTAFCRDAGLESERQFFEKSIAALVAADNSGRTGPAAAEAEATQEPRP